MIQTKKMISAVVACYKDAQAIPLMAERLTKLFEKIGCEHEVIFVNDGSPDNTQEVLETLAARDSRIKGITHSRNFGSQSAFTSGLARASGHACVFLDGDLQDPVEVIEEFYHKWIQGFDVVYGVRTHREMAWAESWVRKVFYRVFRLMSYIAMPLDAGDFSLIDRKVMTALMALPERDRFIRGLRAWVGFKQTGVPYRRPARLFGSSTNSLISNVRWARKGIFSFSYIPIEIISVMALAVSALAVVAIVLQVLGVIIRPESFHGAGLGITVSLFLGSVQLVSLAFISEYIGKIFEEVKNRPLYIVASTINLD